MVSRNDPLPLSLVFVTKSVLSKVRPSGTFEQRTGRTAAAQRVPPFGAAVLVEEIRIFCFYHALSWI
jgi:hypothetical protein